MFSATATGKERPEVVPGLEMSHGSSRGEVRQCIALYRLLSSRVTERQRESRWYFEASVFLLSIDWFVGIAVAFTSCYSGDGIFF